jgi:hypothetical protein
MITCGRSAEALPKTRTAAKSLGGCESTGDAPGHSGTGRSHVSGSIDLPTHIDRAHAHDLCIARVLLNKLGNPQQSASCGCVSSRRSREWDFQCPIEQAARRLVGRGETHLARA